MSEVDLIPAEYRRYRRLLKDGTRFLVLLGALLLVIGSSRLWLQRMLDDQRDGIERLKAGEMAILDQRRTLEDLRKKEADLSSRLKVLEDLRGGPPAEKVFLLVDRAMEEKAWFTRWKFLRPGREAESSRQGRNSYFIVVPEGQRKSAGASGEDKTRMEIKGMALSHSALASFVRRLLRENEVEDVRVVDTAPRSYGFGDAVSYEVEVSLSSSSREVR